MEEEYRLQWVYPNHALNLIEKDYVNYPKITQLMKKESTVPHRELAFMKAILHA
jgi:hypothetical protein